MGNTNYLYPLPKDKLLARFKPVFKKLSEGFSATLIALPHTGRTSHLRFITTRAELLHKLSINTNNVEFFFIDIDKTNGTYESFLLEIADSLLKTKTVTPITFLEKARDSFDSYLLGSQIIKYTTKLCEGKKAIFVITLKNKVSTIVKEIENFTVHLQKTCGPKNLSILWSIDTSILRNYEAGHMSSTIFDNIFYFPTFDERETIYSIQRYLELKGLRLSNKNLKKALYETGGVASLFHKYAQGVSKTLLDHEILKSLKRTEERIIEDLYNESKSNEKLFELLTSKYTRDFIESRILSNAIYGNFKFKNLPTAQELNILNLLKEKINLPVSRDEIAVALWGKAWSTKYSDWAIDKAVSRLRKNLLSEEIKIITVKNLGYQLIKL